MPLKKSSGNMYPWVTHTWSILSGACPHRCSYCYVRAMAKRFSNMRARYTGPVRLVEDELDRPLGKNRTIFVEHMSDLFAQDVPLETIQRVLALCRAFPHNTYVFQTKNPIRYQMFKKQFPAASILGTTIETNRRYTVVMGSTILPSQRISAMDDVPLSFQTFVTIEPVLDFDVDVLSDWLISITPTFVNIGADSKGAGLPEPRADKIRALLARLAGAEIEVRQKTNLARLLT